MQVLDLGSSMAPRRRAWHVLPLICRYVHDAAAAAVTWPRPRATGLIHGSLFVNRSRSIEHRDGCSLHLHKYVLPPMSIHYGLLLKITY